MEQVIMIFEVEEIIYLKKILDDSILTNHSDNPSVLSLKSKIIRAYNNLVKEIGVREE